MLFNPSDHEGGLCGFVYSALILRKERGGEGLMSSLTTFTVVVAGWDRRESAFSFLRSSKLASCL